MQILLGLLLALPCLAIDNGLGLVPPRGWRSWNAYTCTDSSNTTLTGGNILTDAVMRAAFHAVLDKSRSVGGKPTTLASLGYDYVSMDDGWQQCNCSTRQAIDPALPTCSIHTCTVGGCSWHDQAGTPLVNKHRFPHGMRSLVDYGRASIGFHRNFWSMMTANATGSAPIRKARAGGSCRH